jgi:hypothetical protein
MPLQKMTKKVPTMIRDELDIERPAPADIWEYVEQAPAFVGAIAQLWSWSLNYEHGDARRPFPLFLDLVGYSQERYGSKCSVWGTTEADGLGWIELDLLGKALCEYADAPHDCDRWLDGLDESESE